MNSRPTTLLRNTSTGIRESNIIKLPARIVAEPGGVGEGEHLELVLGEHMEDKTVEYRTTRVNQVYLYGRSLRPIGHIVIGTFLYNS